MIIHHVMNTDQADIDLIERHLSGQLSHAEVVDFEIRLGEDHEFARKFRLRKTFPSLFKAEGPDEIAMAVEDAPQPRIRKKRVRSKKTRSLLLGVIILLLAGILSYFLFVKINQPLQPAAEPLQSHVPATPTARIPEQPIARESELNVSKPIVLEAPAEGMIFNRSEEMLFRWKMATDTFTNFYLISEANNKLAWWRGIRPGTRECIIPANKLFPGKFYWYVGTKEFSRTVVVSQ